MREQYNHWEMVKETEPHVLHTERPIDQSINQSINQDPWQPKHEQYVFYRLLLYRRTRAKTTVVIM
jgi:hypothetical protein